jgi:uncharacterized membrane protein
MNAIPPTPPRPDRFHEWSRKAGHITSDHQVEDQLVGTWFARIGAMALVAGAGSAFAYAVQRGWIGPAGRLATALTLGIGAILGAERARARSWRAPAQALAAAGTALLYLTVWASSRIYGYIPLGVGLLVLSGIAVLGALLALRHDSEALALMSLGAGFLNPYASEAANGSALLGYVAALDIGVLVIASFRTWRIVPRVALIGSWLVAYASGPFAPTAQIGWGSAIFAIFVAYAFLTDRRDRPFDPADATLLVANLFAYLAFVVSALGPSAQGAAAFSIAAGLAGLCLLARRLAGDDSLLGSTLAGLAVAVAVLAVPLQFHGMTIGTAWSLEGVLLLWLGRQTTKLRFRVTGLALLGLGLMQSVGIGLQFGAAYNPSRVLISRESLTVAIQIAALTCAIALLPRRSEEEWERISRKAAIVTVNVLAIGWACAEAHAYLVRHFSGVELERAMAFSLSGIWALYAAGMFAVGIAWGLRDIRLMAVGLFGVTLLKMVLNDAWMLSGGQRALVFAGVGILLMACSLAYHRFRDLLLGYSTDGAPSDPTVAA